MEVPDKATDFSIVRNIFGAPYSVKWKVYQSEHKWISTYRGLPFDKPKIFADSETITTEQMTEVVGERTIYTINSAYGVPQNEPCALSMCDANADGRHFAMVYEGEYCNDIDKAAGIPVCKKHSLEAIDVFYQMLLENNILGRFIIFCENA